MGISERTDDAARKRGSGIPPRPIATFVLFIAAIVLLTSVSGFADTCDKDLVPVDNPATQYRSRGGERCEGFYQAKVSTGGVLRITGLTHGVLSYPLEEGTEVTLSCPLLQDQHAHIQGVGIPLRMYYRMDAEIAPEQSILWPLDDVIYPQQVAAEDIGILAWLIPEEPDDVDRVYIPVLAASSSEEQATEETIILSVRSAVDIEAVQWRLAERTEDACGAFGQWAHMDPSTCLAGRAIRIDLPSIESRWMCVEVAARSQTTGDWLKLHVVILVRPEDSDEQSDASSTSS